MGIREDLIEAGWKQGTLLAANDVRFKENAHYEVPDDALFLIVSQTCDLVQGSFGSEPYFETLCLNPLAQEPNGGYLGGKNSRRMEFSLELTQGETTHWFVLPHKRHLVERESLLNLQPESAIEDERTLTMILRWLSRRYTRTAFPEAFVSRINERKDPIGKKFSRLNRQISNVYLRLSPFVELDGADEYSMEIILLMDAKKFDIPEKWKLCEEIKKQLEDQLTKCKGIKVDEISVSSSADVTIEDLKGFLEWDYSYLSFREPEEAAMPIQV